jgi:hypothetical protein
VAAAGHGIIVLVTNLRLPSLVDTDSVSIRNNKVTHRVDLFEFSFMDFSHGQYLCSDYQYMSSDPVNKDALQRDSKPGRMSVHVIC